MKLIVILYFFPNQTQSHWIEYSEALQVLARNDYFTGISVFAFLRAASWDAFWSLNTVSINEAQSLHCYNLKITALLNSVINVKIFTPNQ